MKALNPTDVRLSNSFLLSDFMVCDSVVRYGYPNRIYDTDDAKIEEGIYLAEKIETLIDLFGPCGISYGYISPELSRKVVTYQDPDIPSYHRWDKGAAADLFFPEMIDEGDNRNSPIALVYDIEEANVDYSRLITYAESPWICFAVNRSEGPNPRKALYENRFTGERKPEHIHYPSGRALRLERLMDAQENPVKWEGRGWPSYHGKGRLQFQHQGVSEYATMLKFLYNPEYTHKGVANMPPLTNREAMERWWLCAQQAGNIVDILTSTYNTHISVTSAYVKGVSGRDWQDFATLEVALPNRVSSGDILHTLNNLSFVEKAKVCRDTAITKVRITCHEIKYKGPMGSSGTKD